MHDTDSTASHAAACVCCGACCRWPGDVHVTAAEVERIAAFLGVDVHAFTRDYTRLTRNRRGLSLVERDDGSCTFLSETNRCRIHAVKPQQCRDFPVKWRAPGYDDVCRACHPQPRQQSD